MFVLTVWITEVFQDPVEGSKSCCVRHCTHIINLWPQRSCRMGNFSVFVSQQCSDVFSLSLSLTVQLFSAKPILVISSNALCSPWLNRTIPSALAGGYKGRGEEEGNSLFWESDPSQPAGFPAQSHPLSLTGAYIGSNTLELGSPANGYQALLSAGCSKHSN